MTFYRKISKWLGGLAVGFFLLACLFGFFQLGPLRNALSFGVAAVCCFCWMCVLRATALTEAERFKTILRVSGACLAAILLIVLLLPGPKATWGKQVRGTAPKLIEVEKGKRLSEYFRQANKGATSYRGGTAERNVPEGLRHAILKRDRRRCLICGSKGGKEGLEVDHSRALMNGGSNEARNLASLCIPCHVEKTAMDKSLRRFREK